MQWNVILFQAKISKIHNKNYKAFSICMSKTYDGNTSKKCSQCMNTVMQNMNGN